MVDGYKGNVTHVTKEKLLANEYLDFNTTINSNGEIVGKQVAKYNGTLFSIKANTIWASGSLQKYGNGVKGKGVQNYDDFDLSDIIKALDDLKHKFEIQPRSTSLAHLEFGVNIIIPFDPSEFLNENIIAWNFKTPTLDKDKFEGAHQKGRYVEFRKSEYSIKIYHKSLQYGIHDKNILRFEKRIKSSRLIRELGVKTLHDVQFKEVLLAFKIELLKEFDKFIISDGIAQLGIIDKHDREKIKECMNPKYWSNFPFHRNKKRPHLESFQRLLSKYGLDSKRNFIRQAIINKCDQLIEGNISSHLDKDKVTFPVLYIDRECYPSKNKVAKVIELNPAPVDQDELKKLRYQRNRLRIKIERQLHLEQRGILFPLATVITLSDYQLEMLNYWRDTKWDILGKLGM